MNDTTEEKLEQLTRGEWVEIDLGQTTVSGEVESTEPLQINPNDGVTVHYTISGDVVYRATWKDDGYGGVEETQLSGRIKSVHIPETDGGVTTTDK